jgi:hypothetical protein
MRRSQRLIAAAVLISLSGVLAGCANSFDKLADWDPTDMLDFLDTKKKIPGDRKPVFPEGVPGLEQGVPKQMYKGSAQERIDQQNAEAAAAATPAPAPRSKQAKSKNKPPAAPVDAPTDAAAAEEGGANAAPPAPKPKKIVRQRTTAPPPDQQAAQPAPSGQPAQPAQSAPPQQSAAPFPAPMQSGNFTR